ncbi:MAG: undecaprenyldiphospho-muramoylpentapeptide beta-N-acetylglucosaminyltransferase [Ignavibacteriaceae bacterium]|jgi:UDP-N-acetylglucosamine--N-acetylmuramyl-(pentapeptide) pyrophosphoryl-undecaprenol N-acetylglucosamine transferase
MKTATPYRFLFAGGGTGGHLFPAVAVAEKIRLMKPEAEIIFLGTKSKIEGRVVPQLGFQFKPIWIKGFARKFSVENFLFPVKLLVSVFQSMFYCLMFRPKVAIGSGGYVAGPALFAANLFGAKIILLEQNSFPGVTTRLLERFAQEIHISYENSKKYFKRNKLLFVTGNPVRNVGSLLEKEIALEKLHLSKDKKTLLLLGGSLGAKKLNQVMAKSLPSLIESDLQIIWQTGSLYYDHYKHLQSDVCKVMAFVEDMRLVYSACDVVISRAGATTLAEITSFGLASILIPSPNVAENHQYYNAKSLIDANAAILLEEKNIEDNFVAEILSLMRNENQLKTIRTNAKKLGKPNASEEIANRALSLAERNYEKEINV